MTKLSPEWLRYGKHNGEVYGIKFPYDGSSKTTDNEMK